MLLIVLFFVMFGVGGVIMAVTQKFAIGIPLIVIGFVGFGAMGCVMAVSFENNNAQVPKTICICMCTDVHTQMHIHKCTYHNTNAPTNA